MTSFAECGAAYFSRQYRLRDAPLPAPPTTRLVAGLDEFTIGIWAGDNGTMQIALAPLAADRRFAVAHDPQIFTAAVRSVPYYAAWLDVLDPLSDVFVMGGLHNTLRRLVVHGVPVVHGLHAVGDSVCTTNPTFGRGLSVVMRTVVDLVDTVAAHPDDLNAQAAVLDRLIGEHIAPWYGDQAATDAARLAALRHAVLGAPLSVPSPAADHITFSELRHAGQFDAAAFRAVWRIMGMLGRPSDVYADPALVARVRRTLAERVPARMPQPTRDELGAALSRGTAT